jgi:hypothetical protein
MKLSERECIPCRGGVSALPGEECLALLAELEGWKIVDGALTKSYKFIYTSLGDCSKSIFLLTQSKD